MSHSQPLLSLFSSFQQLTFGKYVCYKNLPMTGFEPRTSGFGSNHSSNWATTTSHWFNLFVSSVNNIQINIISSFINCHLEIVLLLQSGIQGPLPSQPRRSIETKLLNIFCRHDVNNSKKMCTIWGTICTYNQHYWNRRFAIPEVWSNAGTPWQTGSSHQVSHEGAQNGAL